MTIHDLAQIGSHNKREKKAYNSNPDIKQELSKNNIELVPLTEKYVKGFYNLTNEYRKQHEEKQKTERADRKKTFNQMLNKSRNVVADELLFTATSEIFKVTVPLIKNIENKSGYITSSKLKELILEFIVNSEGKTRQEINDYIYPLLNEELSSKNNRVRASLTYLKKKGFINNSGSDTKSLWKKV